MRTTAIVLHGRGQGPALTRELIVDRLALADIDYVLPAAPGDTWYPTTFLAPLADNQPQLDAAIARVLAVSDSLAASGVPFAQQAFVGFSQGACLACEALYRAGRRVGALIAFTGGLIGPPESASAWHVRDAAFADMPVLLGGSHDDPFVPAARMSETAAALRLRGARVSFALFAGADHAIAEPQVLEARAILAEIAARPRAVAASA